MNEDNKIKATSYRFPKKIINLIDSLSDKLSISKTAVLKLAILEFAKKYEVEDATKFD